MSLIAVLPRDVHPVAWWTWTIGLAAAASQTTNPWLLVLVTMTAVVTVLARRTEAPWALSFRLYLWLGLVVVCVRVLFRVLLGGGFGSTVLVTLPQVTLPSWAAGIQLLGPVTQEAVLAGLYDGMRLATILVCVGAANSLANPRRLLAALPAALYEVGTALVVALSVFPQLAESVQRVRRARRLRGDPGRGPRHLRSLVVPVLEDALERSMKLAASMDSRGYGRAGTATPSERRLTGSLLVGGLLGLCVGTYAYLDATAPRVLARPMLALGVLLALAGFVTAGRRAHRTTYRPDPWRLAEVLTAGSGVAAAVLVGLVAHRDPLVLIPDVTGAPPLTVLALLAATVGLVPAFCTPRPMLPAVPESPAHRATGPTGRAPERVAEPLAERATGPAA